MPKKKSKRSKSQGESRKGAAAPVAGQSPATSNELVDVEALLAEIEQHRESARGNVHGLRDGTYEMDEKIELFRTRISKVPLVELERMFGHKA